MDTFTASNGVKITHLENGDQIGMSAAVPGDPREYTEWTGGRFTQALREFFRAEEDERLGRWRFPEKDCMVVYPQADRFRVVDERDGDAVYIFRGELRTPPFRNRFYAAVGAYDDAHPEPKPAWHDARCGEVWILGGVHLDVAVTVVGGHDLWFTRADVFGKVQRIELTDPTITEARRIWPEVS